LFVDDKKEDIRSKVWNYLDKNQLSQLFSPFKKISNFKVVVVVITIVFFARIYKHEWDGNAYVVNLQHNPRMKIPGSGLGIPGTRSVGYFAEFASALKYFHFWFHY